MKSSQNDTVLKRVKNQSSTKFEGYCAFQGYFLFVDLLILILIDIFNI